MRPRSFTRALLVCAVSVLCWLAQDARAGVTIDVVFQDATTPTGITLNGYRNTVNVIGPGCVFSGYYGNSVTSGWCMDVILTTTYDFISMGVSVAYDNDNGLAVGQVKEWIDYGFCTPFGGLVDYGGILQAFDCSVPPPNAPPQVPAGTYKIGTIIWDTSGVTTGTETIAAVIAGGDGFGAVINGNILDITGQVVVRSHLVNILWIVPEPGTAALVGLGLVGLVLAARRRGLP